MQYIISALIGLAVSVGGWFGLQSQAPLIEQKVGAFSDPFVSIQLATSPSNGNCLTTDGTNNAWSSSCGSGGGGIGDPFYHPTITTSATNTPLKLFGGVTTTDISANRGYFGIVIATSTTATSTFAHGVSSAGLLVNGGFNLNGPIYVNTVEYSRFDGNVNFTNGVDLSNGAAFRFFGGDLTDQWGTFEVIDNGNPAFGNSVFSTDLEFDLTHAAAGQKNTLPLGNGYFVISSTTPIAVPAINATSTTATSTFAGGIDIPGGGLEGSTLVSCDTIDTTSTGVLTCGSDGGGSGGGFGESWKLQAFNGTTFLQPTSTTPVALPHGTLYLGNGLATSTVTSVGGRLGFASTSPWATFSISATSTLSTVPVFAVSTSTATATTSAFVIDSNGKVGIGTTSPLGTLSIQGNLVVTGANNASSSIHGGLNTAGISSGNGLTITGGALKVDTLTSAIVLTNSSGVALEYAGTSCTNQFVRSLDALGAATCASINNGDWSGTDLSVANGGTGLSTFGGTNTILYTTAADTLASQNNFIFNQTTNRMGIGSTTPTARLSLDGFTNSPTVPIFNIGTSSTGTGTTTALIVDGNGRLAIGTTTAREQVTIQAQVGIYGSQAATSSVSCVSRDGSGKYCALVLSGIDASGTRFCRELWLSPTSTIMFNQREVSCP